MQVPEPRAVSAPSSGRQARGRGMAGNRECFVLVRTDAKEHVLGVDVVGDGLDPVREELGVIDERAVRVPPDRPAIVQVDVLVCRARRRGLSGRRDGGGRRAAAHSRRREGRRRPWRRRSPGASWRPAARCRASRSRRSGSTSSCSSASSSASISASIRSGRGRQPSEGPHPTHWPHSPAHGGPRDAKAIVQRRRQLQPDGTQQQQRAHRSSSPQALG